MFDVDTLECLTVIKTPPNRGAVCGLAVGSDGTVYIGGQNARVQVSRYFFTFQHAKRISAVMHRLKSQQ